MHSIRFRITIITIAAILTSVVSIIGACFITIGSENDRISAEKMHLLCDNVKDSMEDYFNSVEQTVQMSANLAVDSLNGIVLVEEGAPAEDTAGQTIKSSDQNQQLCDYMQEYTDRIREVFGSVASRTKGVVAYYYCINPEVCPSDHGFYYSKAGKTGFDAREPIDASKLDATDTERNMWYFTTVNRGRPSWIGPYKNAMMDDKLTISYVAPIYKAGLLVGVLGMDIPFDTLVSQVESIKVYESGFACLLDENGLVLYHPDQEVGEVPDIAGQTIYQKLLEEKDSGNEVLRYSYDNEQRQMSFTTLSNNMKLVMITPVSEINASWTRLTRMILMITMAIVVFYALLVMLVMGIIIRPLQRLTVASRKLADGDYDVDLGNPGHDEVGVLTGAFSQMRDHIKEYIDDLNRRIYTDDMTGLPNRRFFTRLAEDARTYMLEEGKEPVMLYFNMLGIKFYNRQYGYAEGDKLICEIGRILVRYFGMDRCSYIGQAHFAAVTEEDNIEEVLQNLFRDCLNANNGQSLPIQVGIYPNRLGQVDVNVACDRAKYACDQHKGAYLCRFSWFDSTMVEKMENYRYIINNLDQALEKQWIKVYYQPIIRAANGRVCDEEALSRWIDPVKGYISPGEFIPVLESSRLIYKLDLYVLDQILLKMKKQKEAGLYLVPQSLNLSRVDFDECDITRLIQERVDRAGIPRDKLTIEITESMVGSDFEFMKQQVSKLQSMGFKVWMDDFGSGYSSLDVLQDIHFDLLKFDMHFMHRFDEGDESKIILTHLLNMALSLGIETIAEGVETQEQVDFLKEIGCTKLQGFYFCKAIPLEEIVERNRKGIQIGYENPEETDYYTAIGRINLYDLSAISKDQNDELGDFFDTIPMAVFEADEEQFHVIRCNEAYRSFLKRLASVFGEEKLSDQVRFSSYQIGSLGFFVNAVKGCRDEGEAQFFHRELPNGTTVHAMFRHISTNPVTGVYACVVVILGITR